MFEECGHANRRRGGMDQHPGGCAKRNENTHPSSTGDRATSSDTGCLPRSGIANGAAVPDGVRDCERLRRKGCFECRPADSPSGSRPHSVSRCRAHSAGVDSWSSKWPKDRGVGTSDLRVDSSRLRPRCHSQPNHDRYGQSDFNLGHRHGLDVVSGVGPRLRARAPWCRHVLTLCLCCNGRRADIEAWSATGHRCFHVGCWWRGVGVGVHGLGFWRQRE